MNHLNATVFITERLLALLLSLKCCGEMLMCFLGLCTKYSNLVIVKTALCSVQIHSFLC